MPMETRVCKGDSVSNEDNYKHPKRVSGSGGEGEKKSKQATPALRKDKGDLEGSHKKKTEGSQKPFPPRSDPKIQHRGSNNLGKRIGSARTKGGGSKRNSLVSSSPQLGTPNQRNNFKRYIVKGQQKRGVKMV